MKLEDYGYWLNAAVRETRKRAKCTVTRMSAFDTDKARKLVDRAEKVLELLSHLD